MVQDLRGQRLQLGSREAAEIYSSSRVPTRVMTHTGQGSMPCLPGGTSVSMLSVN